MKTTLFLLVVFAATAAFGQGVGGTALSNEVQVLQIPGHPQHASQQPMAQEQNLFEHFGYFYAEGERPLWEFGKTTQAMPLGDVARMYRQEHLDAKKADIVWNK
jgi:hypothetical protein